MNRFITSLVVASAALVAGCSLHRSSYKVTDLPITHSLIVQDVTLTAAKPTAQLGQYSIRLLYIADDGTTRIRVVQTDEVLSARPGQCFVSYEFGQEGLKLLSASKSSGTATMTSTGCKSEGGPR